MTLCVISQTTSFPNLARPTLHLLYDFSIPSGHPLACPKQFSYLNSRSTYALLLTNELIACMVAMIKCP